MKILYHPYSSMKAGPFKYIETGYLRGFQKAGCSTRIWDGKNANTLKQALSVFKPDVFIGYLRGGNSYNYLNSEWCTGKTFDLLLDYRKQTGLKVALHTHPDVRNIVNNLDINLTKVDQTCAELFYTQKPPPTNIESIMVQEKFIDCILHPYSSTITSLCFNYWETNGIKVLEEPLAADNFIYKPPFIKRRENLDISYIGGWWPFKGIQLDKYLLPLHKRFGDRLNVFGKGWPHLSCGFITDKAYKKIVWKSKINLVFHEPSQVQRLPLHVNERIFKILALGGFAICDNNPCLKEYFTKDELILFSSPDELIDLCTYYISNNAAREKIIAKGRNAVLTRHTYKKRAEKLLAVLKSQ